MKLYSGLLSTLLFVLLSGSFAAAEADRLYETARAAYYNHQHSAALIHVKNILKTTPTHIAAHVLMAEILLKDGSASAAEVALTKAAALGANKQQLQLLFARSYILQGQYNKTLNFLPESTDDDKLSANILVLKGDAHLGLRQLKLAETAYQTALTLNKGNIAAKLALAQVFVNYFKYHQAEVLVDEVLEGYIPPIKAWILKASIKQSFGDNLAALKAINQALLLDKNHLQALIFASTINVELNEYDIAEQYADSILAQVSNEPKAQFIKAIIQARKHESIDPKSAIEGVAQVLDHLSDEVLRSNPSYYYLASIVLFQQHNYESARQYIDAYLVIDSNNINALAHAATIELMAQYPLQAKSLLNRANFLEPDNPKILSMLGMACLRLQQYDKAHYFLEQVRVLLPNSGIADTQIAQSYLADGKLDKAIEHLLTATAAEFEPITVGLLLVEAYIKSADIVKGVSIAKNLAISFPDNANLQHHLGYIYLLTANFELAEEQFNKALLIKENHGKSIVSLAELEYRRGDRNAAESRLKLAISKTPNEIYLIINLAKLYNTIGKYSESVALLQAQYKQHKSNEELLKNYIVSLASNNQTVFAIEILTSYLVSQRKSVDLYLILADLHVRNDDVTSAINGYKSAIKAGGRKGEIFLLMANLYQHYFRIPEAISAYKKAIAWDEGNEQAIVGLSMLYNGENNTKSTIDLIKTFETNHRLSVNLIEVLANAYLRTDQYSLAEKHYKARIEIERNDSSIVALSLIYRHQNKLMKATKLLTHNLKNHEESLLLNSALAELYINQEQWRLADEIYQKLVNLYPQQAAVLNNASYVALNLQDYKRAELLAKQSLTIVDNQPDSLDTLGWIYYHTAAYEEALPLFRKALAINNGNSAAKYHLALTLKALKRDNEAIKLMVEVADSEYSQKANVLLKQWLGHL